jgi:hypothetical protein
MLLKPVYLSTEHVLSKREKCASSDQSPQTLQQAHVFRLSDSLSPKKNPLHRRYVYSQFRLPEQPLSPGAY